MPEQLRASRTLESQQATPFVSVITPFYNTERYLAECIESVLAQTYRNWEYILVNNRSTDASRSIAQRYVANDLRLRLIDTPNHLTQIENFEASLTYMSPRSAYCKMVLADDWMFPECLDRMVAVAEANPTVGLVSSYQLFGDAINGSGFPYPSNVVSGREACRRLLLNDYFFTGSPTSILIRTDIVRRIRPFFPVGWLHEDTEACFRILAEHDLGFVHQILTFSRDHKESLMSTINRFNPGPVRQFIFAKKYGPYFLSQNQYRKHLRQTSDLYGRFLANSLLAFKGRDFWDFHRHGLQYVGCSFWDIGLPKHIFWELLDIIFNPKKTAGRLFRWIRGMLGRSSRPEKTNACA
jgi:glycosyltransferase involved in cell wall biosynthesis